TRCSSLCSSLPMGTMPCTLAALGLYPASCADKTDTLISRMILSDIPFEQFQKAQTHLPDLGFAWPQRIYLQSQPTPMPSKILPRLSLRFREIAKNARPPRTYLQSQPM